MIEMLVYAFILVLITSAVMYTLITLAHLYRSITSISRIESAAYVGLERMVREIRGASGINDALSTFNSTSSVLTLDSTDNSGATTTVRFFLSDTTPHIEVGGIDAGPLAPTSVRVTSLLFRKISTAHSQAVKIETVIESGSGQNYRSKSFYSTVVLRGSYPIQ